MDLTILPLDALLPHPANSNVMPPALLTKLADHIARSDRYPPVIVRRLPGDDGKYQILDGHHRVKALRMLGRAEARCVVWDVDDAEALLLMATLNRLQGRDDLRKRASLLSDLSAIPGHDHAGLARLLPEDLPDLNGLLALHAAPQNPRPPRALEDMPVAVHFFLLPAQRDTLEQRLRDLGGDREDALMRLIAE
jgi:ParB-like chromosome segregation protein Spo0J